MAGVDVVVAMYNAKSWIVDCIEGILASPSGEVRALVADDGSTDGCADLVAAGYAGHPRVVLHRWAREMEALGHEVKLIAPQYVRPFVKRQSE